MKHLATKIMDNMQLQKEILILIALNRYPVSLDTLGAVMKHSVAKRYFRALYDTNYIECLMPASLRQLLGDRVIYDENTRLYSLASTKENDILTLEAMRECPELAKVISQELNRMSMPEPQGQLRDIRNFTYTADMASIKGCFKDVSFILSENAKAFEHPGQLFAFVDNVEDNEWLDELSHDFINLLCANYIPYAFMNLKNVRHLAFVASKCADELTANALASLADFSLLDCDMDGAEKYISKLKGVQQLQRIALKHFMAGDKSSAIKEFEEVLSKAKPDQIRDFFNGMAGIAYVFALVANGDMSKAMEIATQGAQVSLLKQAYERLNGCIVFFASRHRASAQNEPDYDSSSKRLECLLEVICDFAEEKSIELDAQAKMLRDAADAYPWFDNDISRVLAYYSVFNSDTPLCDKSRKGLLDSLPMRPLWERDVENIQKLAEGHENESRLVWFCREVQSQNCRVLLYPYEQKVTKSGTWSSGSRFPLLMTSDKGDWPSYMTMQDQMMCRIIAEEAHALGMTLLDSSGFASKKALLAAVDHPLLFWVKDNDRTHFSCRREKPVVGISLDDENFCLSMRTKPAQDGIVVNVDTQDDVVVYPFTDLQLDIAKRLIGDIRVPSGSPQKLNRLLCVLARHFSILSDIPLDFMEIPVRECDCEFHFKLMPHDERMTVELYISLFNGLNGFALPGEGPLEAVVIQDGMPARLVRDFQDEIENARQLIDSCAIISDMYEKGRWNWELENLEQCYEFVYSLRELLGKVFVHWPDNKKISVTRKLKISDISVQCKQKNDWFFSVEGTVALGDGNSVSLDELLAAARQSNSNFIRLKDGQVLALADSFRKKLDDIAAVTNVIDGEITICRAASLFVRELMAGGDANAVAKLNEEFDNAQNLVPDIPADLNATLRPYQIEGFNWLCRIDAWGAGACLADDMGLGKTVQVIAFLLRNADEGPALVVAPTSVCSNWLHELERFAPTLKVISFGGAHRSELLEEMGPRTVMVSSYGLLQSEEEEFKKIQWRTAVLDEAQAIKNHNTKRAQAVVFLKAKCRIVTTGTPIENNLNELWSIFNFVNPGLLGEHSEFQERFAAPIEIGHQEDVLARLSAIVKPFVLRRLKKNVLKDLPAKTEIQQVVNLSSAERDFYDRYRQQLLDEIHNEKLPPGKERMKVIAAITKLRLAACNARLILPEVDMPSSKMDAFCDLLEQLLAEKHKILVFSQYVKHLTLVRHVLDGKNIRYQYMDGEMSMDERDAAVNTFQNDAENYVFLISLKTGGTGLNLTAADYVIHLDPWWNPAVEDQASDRAHRIGQTRPVTIYRLIAKGTIEEKIIELHQNKRELAENILAGTDTVKKTTREELLKLLQ